MVKYLSQQKVFQTKVVEKTCIMPNKPFQQVLGFSRQLQGIFRLSSHNLNTNGAIQSHFMLMVLAHLTHLFRFQNIFGKIIYLPMKLTSTFLLRNKRRIIHGHKCVCQRNYCKQMITGQGGT